MGSEVSVCVSERAEEQQSLTDTVFQPVFETEKFAEKSAADEGQHHDGQARFRTDQRRAQRYGDHTEDKGQIFSDAPGQMPAERGSEQTARRKAATVCDDSDHDVPPRGSGCRHE